MDQIQDTVLTIDPITGAIGADFSGRVHAAGIDLTDFAGSGDIQKIIWTRASDGALIADIIGTTRSGAKNVETIMRAIVPESGGQATCGLQAWGFDDKYSSIWCESFDNNVPERKVMVHAHSDGGTLQQKKLFDGNKKSDWVFQPKIQAGVRIVGVNTTAESSIWSGGNPVFQFENLLNKTYRITFSGSYNHSSAGGSLLIKLKCGTTQLESFSIAQPASNLTGQDLELKTICSVRTIGSSGVVCGLWSRYAQSSATQYIGRGFATTADVTGSPNLDITCAFVNASANNGVTIEHILAEEFA